MAAQPPPLPRRRPAFAAVAFSVALLFGLSACEYEYEPDRVWIEDVAPAAAAPVTDAALPVDPDDLEPVAGDELVDWVNDVLPDAQGQIFHTGYGTVDPVIPRAETTGQLPSGSYSLTLACRSTDRVSFTIRNGDSALVDLSLRCGSSRVNVVYLPADAVLTLQVTGQAAANYAYRVNRI